MKLLKRTKLHSIVFLLDVFTNLVLCISPNNKEALDLLMLMVHVFLCDFLRGLFSNSQAVVACKFIKRLTTFEVGSETVYVYTIRNQSKSYRVNLEADRHA